MLGLGAVGLMGMNVACSSAAADSSFDEDSDVRGGKDDASSANDDAFAEPVATPSSGDGCREEARFVYVLSREMGLYRFDPSALAFTKVGDLACPNPGREPGSSRAGSPNSMAVDRQGTAWVNYTSGKLFKVSTTDASCQETAYVPGQSGVYKVGMAFASNGAGSTSETLYVVGIDDTDDGLVGQGLSKIDLSTFELSRIGSFSDGLEAHGAELTGTGDGRLYGFVTTGNQSATKLAGIEMTSGKTPTTEQASLAGVRTGSAFAFSFWGGDFWFYTAQGARPSNVTRYRPSDGSIEVVKESIGFAIVGAGVSTCAPTTPPK